MCAHAQHTLFYRLSILYSVANRSKTPENRQTTSIDSTSTPALGEDSLFHLPSHLLLLAIILQFTLLLKWTWLTDWYERQCINMSNRVAHSGQRYNILQSMVTQSAIKRESWCNSSSVYSKPIQCEHNLVTLLTVAVLSLPLWWRREKTFPKLQKN